MELSELDHSITLSSRKVSVDGILRVDLHLARRFFSFANLVLYRTLDTILS